MKLLRQLVFASLLTLAAPFLGAQSNETIPMAMPVEDSAEEAIPTASPVDDSADIPTAQPVIDPTLPSNTNVSLPVEQNQTQVAILGYHDFSETKSITDMRIRTSVFREQMMSIKRSGIAIISLQDLLDWKIGTKKLPAHCVLITIDDGWKSVYTDAYPILKELNIPFTIFVYTSFIGGQGASLSIDQIKEMMNNGCSVGSHSSKHLYPSAWTKAQKAGEANYLALIESELKDSALLLRKTFSAPIDTYCYPGGFFTDEMILAAPKAGYKLAFTVQPQKVTRSTDNFTMHRYMVYGKRPISFTNALQFGAINDQGKDPTRIRNEEISPDNTTFSPIPLFPVSPAPNSTHLPFMGEISINLSSIPNIQPGSLSLQVSGLGKVPYKWNVETRTLTWTPLRKLYGPIITVQASWQVQGAAAKQNSIWKFRIKDVALPASM